MSESINYSKTYPWLNQALFERVLAKSENIVAPSVTGFVLKSALAKNENYSSEMIRARVTFRSGANVDEQSKSFIIKAGHVNDTISELVDEFDGFKKEVSVFGDILPKCNEILAAASVNVRLAPRCFETNIRPSYMVFEDLSEEHYANVDRKVGLDVAHLRFTVTKLAKWHASTAFVGTAEPELLRPFIDPILKPDQTAIFGILTNTLGACATEARSWPGFEKIADKLERLRGTIIEKVIGTYVRSEGDFNVITHGDMWSNNLMFTHDNQNNVTGSIMVDFALGFWGSPAIDLSYLLFTSSHVTVSEIDWDLLLQLYHTELLSTLQTLGYAGTVPSLTDIHAAMLKKSMNSVAISIILVGLRQLENTVNADISRLLSEKAEDVQFRKDLVAQPMYRRDMEHLLKFFDRKGLLD